MNKTSRTITGGLGVVIGAIIIAAGLVNKAWVVVVIYGLPLLVLGVFIIFNKKEDQIEQIKKKKDE